MSKKRTILVGAVVLLLLLVGCPKKPVPPAPPPPPPAPPPAAPPPAPPAETSPPTDDAAPAPTAVPVPEPIEDEPLPDPSLSRQAEKLRRAERPRRARNCPTNYPDCTVDVYYGTNRSTQSGKTSVANDHYGSSDSQRLELGALTVSFPSGHVSGKIERPKIYKFEFREDPEKHVMMVKLEPDLSEADWLEQVKAKGQEDAFVFVHGYNTQFAASAWRAAQIAYDLDFAGVPLMYSWPSVGGGLKGVFAYSHDEASVKTAVPHFRRFLKLVADRAGLETVHVIAHSMGNRLVTAALDEMCRQERQPPLISQLVLAAPDVDTRAFQERFLDTLPRIARRVTIYASSKDKALNASQLVHGREPRLGDAMNDLLWTFNDVERIDASFIADTLDSSEGSKDFLQHSYFASNNSVSSDLFCLLRQHAERPLLAPKAGMVAAWDLKPIEADRRACGQPLPEQELATCAQLFEQWSAPVPDLLDLTLEQAREALLAADLTVGIVRPEPSRAALGNGPPSSGRWRAGRARQPGGSMARRASRLEVLGVAAPPIAPCLRAAGSLAAAAKSVQLAHHG